MVAQSGGPTVAINASLAGVIRGVMASDQYETVYGSVNGILGILNNHLLNLTEIMNENPAYLDRLETTPAMYLGSCRHKLPDYLDEELKKGTYPCTATFEAYDTKTNEKAGEASAKLKIKVKE